MFLCLDYSRSNEQIFRKNSMSEGPGQRKELLIFVNALDHILDTNFDDNFFSRKGLVKGRSN